MLKEDILVSTLDMLNTRYSNEHNVTVQSVIEKHVQQNFRMKRYLCRNTTKSLCLHLVEAGLLRPYMMDDKPMRGTWRIDFSVLADLIAHPQMS